jgi:hypothetical protein
VQQCHHRMQQCYHTYGKVHQVRSCAVSMMNGSHDLHVRIWSVIIKTIAGCCGLTSYLAGEADAAGVGVVHQQALGAVAAVVRVVALGLHVARCTPTPYMKDAEFKLSRGGSCNQQLCSGCTVHLSRARARCMHKADAGCSSQSGCTSHQLERGPCNGVWS